MELLFKLTINYSYLSGVELHALIFSDHFDTPDDHSPKP